VELSRTALRKIDEILQGPHGKLRVNHQAKPAGGEQHHRREAVDRIEVQMTADGRDHAKRGRNEEQRVPVRRRFCHVRSGDGAGCADPVFRDDVCLPALREPGPEQAREDIGAGAW
jgi:hypothetical protein